MTLLLHALFAHINVAVTCATQTVYEILSQDDSSLDKTGNAVNQGDLIYQDYDSNDLEEDDNQIDRVDDNDNIYISNG